MPVPLQFSHYFGSPDRPQLPEFRPPFKSFHPGRVLPASQPARAASDSERVTAMPTRYPLSVSTDGPGTGSDRIWVRSFANTAFVSAYVPQIAQRLLLGSRAFTASI